MSTKVVFIPDTHFPYVNQEAVHKVLDIIEKEKPTHVIQAGDLLDLYSFSRYDRSLNLVMPEVELQEGLEMAESMWEAVRKAVPKAKCVQLIGNHEDRLTKTVMRQAPELMSICRGIKDLYQFKGVEVLDSSKDYYELDGVIYCHGHYTKLGDHAKFFRRPVVHGHSHKIGIFYEQTVDGLIWEMDCGFLADKTVLPLQYTQSKFSKWTTAFGIVDSGSPRLITLGS
jgi:metallophosphoesterase superfamily enzyme